MTDDLRALLAAIVADPADDTARLVYADCLQENGNTARAEFIRFQIEAERLHPDSNARAALEQSAESLFAEHWIDWWGEVCAAVGMFVPRKSPKSMLGRFARRVVNLSLAGDNPYERTLLGVRWDRQNPGHLDKDSYALASFRRVFPEYVAISNHTPSVLESWSRVSPLTHLQVSDKPFGSAHNGPHLTGVRRLDIIGGDSHLFDALSSPYLDQLDTLRLTIPRFGNREGISTEPLTRMIPFARMAQLRQLAIPVWTFQEAELLASAENLAGLASLELDLFSDAYDPSWGSEMTASIAQAPQFAGLRELKVRGYFDVSGLEAIVRNPSWTGLRRLGLDVSACDSLNPLEGDNGLPELEELRLYDVFYRAAVRDNLIRSPLLKQLTHFTLVTGLQSYLDCDIAHAVDPDRIETIAITGLMASRDAAVLRDRFGDRLRLVTQDLTL